MTNENSSNSTTNSISSEMRDLIIRYMEACNEGNNADAESILHQIRKNPDNNKDEQLS